MGLDQTLRLAFNQQVQCLLHKLDPRVSCENIRCESKA